MGNAIVAANDALENLLGQLFPPETLGGAKVQRNPRGRVPDPPKAADKVGRAVVLFDDITPEQKGWMAGNPPLFELEILPEVMFAYVGDIETRDAERWPDLETLKAALDRSQGGDPTLGGAVEWAQLAAPEAAELDRAKWKGGGVVVAVRIWFLAASMAG